MCVISFNLLGLTVPEKSVTKMFNIWKLKRKKNEGMKRKAASWFQYIQYNYPLLMFVWSFNLLGLTFSEKTPTKIFNAWKLETKKNEEIKGRIRAAAWFRYTRYIPSLFTCVPSFNLLGLTVPVKSQWLWRQILTIEHWRERKMKNKGMNKQQPVYTIHLPTVHVCTKFQFSRPHSSWKKCDEKF